MKVQFIIILMLTDATAVDPRRRIISEVSPSYCAQLTCRIIMAVLYISRRQPLCLTAVLYSSSSFVSKGNLRVYWMDSIHTFTQYPVLV